MTTLELNLSPDDIKKLQNNQKIIVSFEIDRFDYLDGSAQIESAWVGRQYSGPLTLMLTLKPFEV